MRVLSAHAYSVSARMRFFACNSRSHLSSGLVLFLEEDHYVTEDFLHVLRLTNEERLARHEDCDIICLGTYLKSPDMKKTAKQVSRPLSLLRILGICVGWASLYPLGSTN